MNSNLILLAAIVAGAVATGYRIQTARQRRRRPGTAANVITLQPAELRGLRSRERAAR